MEFFAQRSSVHSTGDLPWREMSDLAFLSTEWGGTGRLSLSAGGMNLARRLRRRWYCNFRDFRRGPLPNAGRETDAEHQPVVELFLQLAAIGAAAMPRLLEYSREPPSRVGG
jgi:hypothetical protein